MLFLTPVKLDQTFVSSMHVVEAVGGTDVMLDKASTGRLPGRLPLDENGSDGCWIWPRNEQRRRSAPLIKLPFPWLQCRPCQSRCCQCI